MGILICHYFYIIFLLNVSLYILSFISQRELSVFQSNAAQIFIQLSFKQTTTLKIKCSYFIFKSKNIT